MAESITESTSQSDFIESLVAFIDILGFGSRFKTGQDVSSLRSVVAELEFIQKKFDFKSPDKLTNEAQEASHKRVLAFSDSIIVVVGCDAEGYRELGSFDFLLMEIVGIARSQAECVSKGIFLRGGIDQNDRIVSPALNTAYELETKVWAPVIGLSQQLYNEFVQHPTRKDYDKDSEPFVSEVRGFEKDGTKYWFIDYMRIYLHEFEELNDQIHWLLKHAQAIENGFNSCDDEKVKDKYRWLSSYHNEVILQYDDFPKGCIVRLPGQQYETYPADPPTREDAR